MKLDPHTVIDLALAFRPESYLRIMPVAHMSTPLGMGFGQSRFSSPDRSFRLLYAAYDLATAIAETIVRDRFEGVDERVLDESEIEDWAIAEVTAIVPLVLVDLRTTGLLRLGVSTDAARAKQHNEGQTLSEAIHERYAVDDCSIPHALRRQTVWQSMTVLSARNLSPLQPSSSCSKPA